MSIILLYRIHKAVVDKADVDGSYLYKKYQQCGRSRPDLDLSPSPPLSGWETVSETNAAMLLSKKLPYVTNGTVYTYLALPTGQSNRQNAFRASNQGYNTLGI